MGIFNFFKKNKKQDLPLIARVNLAEEMKKREEQWQFGDKSILAVADYTKRFPRIRLYYVSLGKFTRYGTTEEKIGTTFNISSPFRLPIDMTVEDACKVISYLSEKVEKEYDFEPASQSSVAMVSKLLEKYGFDKVEGHVHGYSHAIQEYHAQRRINVTSGHPHKEKVDGIVDLFTVGGDFKLFKKSNLNDRYFNWFTEGVTREEVEKIYEKIHKLYVLEDAEANRVSVVQVEYPDGETRTSALFLDKGKINVDELQDRECR